MERTRAGVDLDATQANKRLESGGTMPSRFITTESVSDVTGRGERRGVGIRSDDSDMFKDYGSSTDTINVDRYRKARVRLQ